MIQPLASASSAPGSAGADTIATHLRRSSLNHALDVVGDWWIQRILREAFLGVHRFEDFQAHLGIPRQTLSQRLKWLVAQGVFDATRNNGYKLTPAGLALHPWALLVWRWTQKWGNGAEPRHPQELRHHDCGRTMTPMFACDACLHEVGLRDVSYQHAEYTGVPTRADEPPPAPQRRWSAGRAQDKTTTARQHLAFVTADRWAHLILSGIFLGCRSFDQLGRELGIATNVLAQRLALLVDTGFLKKSRSPSDARRFDYRLTERSRDVFPLSIALIQWADIWMPAPDGPPILRYHRNCGARLQAKVLCSHCRHELLPQAVTFQFTPLVDPIDPSSTLIPEQVQ